MQNNQLTIIVSMLSIPLVTSSSRTNSFTELEPWIEKTEKFRPILRMFSSPVIRFYPPLSTIDPGRITIDSNGHPILQPIHPFPNLFDDHEIVALYEPIRDERIEEIRIRYTHHQKSIIQQQCLHGSSRATAAMLIKDRNGYPNFRNLQFCISGNNAQICSDLRIAGIFSRVSQPRTIEELRNLILRTGPAIVSLEDPLVGSHYVIIDAIAPDCQFVRLRDPFHEWEICVKNFAFLRRWDTLGEAIQTP